MRTVSLMFVPSMMNSRPRASITRSGRYAIVLRDSIGDATASLDVVLPSGRLTWGRIVETAPTDDLFRDPNHPYTQALLAEAPRLETDRRIYAPIKGEIPSPLDPPSGCRFHTRCPFALDRCRREEPSLEDAGGGHQAACHRKDEVEKLVFDRFGRDFSL